LPGCPAEHPGNRASAIITSGPVECRPEPTGGNRIVRILARSSAMRNDT